MKTTSKPHWQTQYTVAASNFWNLFRFNNQVKTLFSQPSHHCIHTLRVFLLVCWVRGRRQAHNPTLTKIMRLTYNRSCSHNRPQTAACNAVYSISRRALLITRLGEQLPRPRQVSMPLETILGVLTGVEGRDVLWEKPLSLSHTQSVSSAGLATSIFGSQVHDREVPYSFPEGFKYP